MVRRVDRNTNPLAEKRADTGKRRCTICRPGRGCNSNRKVNHGVKKPKYKDHRSGKTR